MLDIDISALKFMIIDDSRFMRNTIKNLLHACYVKKICETVDGAESLEAMESFRPDIVLVDWEMKPLGGINFVKHIRRDKNSPDRNVAVNSFKIPTPKNIIN